MIERDLSILNKEIIYTPYIEKTAIVFSENQLLSNYKQTYKQREGVYVFGVQESFLLNNSLINKYFNNKDFIFIDNEFYCNGIIGDFLNQNRNNTIELSTQKFMIEEWDSQNVLKFLNSFDIPVKLLMWILMFLSVYSLSSLIFNFLIEKRKDLKILYLMGYSKKNLRYITISISLYISIISIFIGILISSLVIYLQNQFQIINLPSEKIFQLTFLPAHFDIFYFIKYPIFLILFTILISLYVFNKNFKIYLK